MKEINYLKENGKIDLIAPSFGCTTEPYATRLDAAIKNLKKIGFKVKEGPNVRLAKGNLRSNTAKKCAEEFNEAYKSNSNFIISVGGGETMCEILPYIDFEMCKNLPHKFFMGFSDNTNLTYTLCTISEVSTIYGPCAPSFAFINEKGFSPLKDSLALAMKKTKKLKGYPKWLKESDHELSAQKPLMKFKYDQKKVLKVVSKDGEFKVNGRLLGGCLDCLVNLCGTKFDKTKEYIEKYKKDGFVWFIEACDLSPVGIERALFQLKEAGWFKYAKGFIFGRPLHFDEIFGDLDRIKAVKIGLKGIKAPYVLDVDLGHFDPSIPIICGEMCEISVKKGNIYFKY